MELEQNKRAVRIVLFVVLAASVATAFATHGPLWERVRLGELPMWIPFVAPALFTVFVAVFSVDRYIQVRRGTYPVGRALFQLGLAVVFLAFLWPQQARELRAAREGPPLRAPVELLNHHQASVRALACDAIGLSATKDATARIRERLEIERDARVVARCEAALARQ
ncbi:MAG: hypothetical protein AAFU77_14935 [Myxococcota bacterium]